MALQKTSRRNFLKGVLAASGAVAATVAPQQACARVRVGRVRLSLAFPARPAS